jgi:hypothetical protein
MTGYGHAPSARAADPATSHAAAASIEGRSPVLRQRQAAVLTALQHAPGTGLTDEELLAVYARWRSSTPSIPEQSPSGIRTRRHELTAMGHVLDTGERRRLVSGRHGIVWAARGHYHPGGTSR